jgi:hypothetical protein
VKWYRRLLRPRVNDTFAAILAQIPPTFKLYGAHTAGDLLRAVEAGEPLGTQYIEVCLKVAMYELQKSSSDTL